MGARRARVRRLRPRSCVITRGDEVPARGRILGKTNDDPTGAWRDGSDLGGCLADYGSVSLRGATLYISGELQVMRMGATAWARYRPAGQFRPPSAPLIGSLTNQISDSPAPQVQWRGAKWDPIKISGGEYSRRRGDEAFAEVNVDVAIYRDRHCEESEGDEANPGFQCRFPGLFAALAMTTRYAKSLAMMRLRVSGKSRSCARRIARETV